jgi:hypothetical protein
MSETKKKFKCASCGEEIPCILNEQTNKVEVRPTCPSCSAENSAIEIVVENLQATKTLLCD